MKILIFIILVLPIFIFAQETDFYWPRDIETSKATITLYQPQLESFHQDTLEGRMAVSINPLESDILFCAVWFKARLSTDLDARIARLEELVIPRVHFPDMEEPETVDKFTELLVNEMQSWDIEMSLDRLLAGLDEVENLSTYSEQLNNDPPDIYFRTETTMLISIDGDPQIKKVDNSNLEYVVNTPFFIVKEQNKKQFYIKGGEFWYVSENVTGDWRETTTVPKDIEKFAADNLVEETEPDSLAPTEAPALLVVAKPSELILIDGEPDYAAIAGTSLLYVKNSESDIIMDINTQDHYVLLAGRWFHSKSLMDGDWKFQEPEDLPADFAKIPEGSDMESVRASVPGTPEAQDALLEQSIPQTATVNRNEASVEVSYDGNPEFKKVDGTQVAYAVNTDKTVLRIDNKYYCVDDAIWFVADNAAGPWIVSDVRPDEVDELPPDCPVQNVKYVYIYDSTPDVVYVGYLPGYTYSYTYHGVVVYGTGYWYRPWYHYYYYPRPVTWGFGVHWNPWTGWGFSFGFSYGWIGWGFHPYRYGWWGPTRYRYGYRHGYRHGYRRGYAHGYRAGYHAGKRQAQKNVYRNRASGVSTMDRARSNNLNNKAINSGKPNNMYVDRNGNIHQRNNNGNWEQRSNPQRPENQIQQPSQRQNNQIQQPSQRDRQPSQTDRQRMERSHQNRDRGTQNYNRSRGGSSRGGAQRGGRRR